MEVVINDIHYEVVKNEGVELDIEELSKYFTEYFLPFDYILGDYAYGKLRLKGFNSKENKNYKPYNDIDTLDDYLKNHCAFGCHYFVISKKNT